MGEKRCGLYGLEGRVSRLEQDGMGGGKQSAAARTDLGSNRLGNILGKLLLGRNLLGKYLTYLVME